jgi:hypothetical protein
MPSRNDDFIQSYLCVNPSVTIGNFDLQHRTRVIAEFFGKRGLHGRYQVGFSRTGQKAKSPKVIAQKRNARSAHKMRGAQGSTIASKTTDEIKTGKRGAEFIKSRIRLARNVARKKLVFDTALFKPRANRF